MTPNPLTPFDQSPRTRILFGPGRLQEIGSLAKDLGGKRVLLVTDAGIIEAGHVAVAERSLREQGLDIERFEDVQQNPTTDDVEKGLQVAKRWKPDLIIALGGGSSIDCAKGINFLYSCGGKMEDYWGVGKAKSEMLPLVAIPTTAGTGSEVQSFALISQAETHRKMACGDPKAAPKIALLDPELTLSAPPAVTAHTGLDTVTHAVEAAVTRKATGVSQLYAFEAFRLSAAALPKILEAPESLEARGAMLQAAAFAGLAIEQSMLGAAHSMANPLTAHFDVIHGVAVGSLLPTVVRFNDDKDGPSEVYRILSRLAGLGHDTASLIAFLGSLLDQARIPSSLSELGVQEDSLEQMAREASEQWTAQFNPRRVTSQDFFALYEQAFACTR